MILKSSLKKVLIGIVLILLFALVGIIGYTVLRTEPENIRFTNISSSSVTVSWTTKSPTRGTAYVLEKDSLLPFSFFSFGKETAHDTRDLRLSELKATQKSSQNINNTDELFISIENFVTSSSVSKQGKYFVHHVDISGLSPESLYKIYIGDGIFFRKAVDGQGLTEIKTIKIPETIPTPIPAYGSIKDANNEELSFENLHSVSDAILYLNYLDESTGEKSNTYSTVVNSDGNWYLDISSARDSEGNIFRDRYLEGITNIYGEIEIETGTKGLWKKVVNIFETAPSAPIVLNDPQAVVDNQDEFQLKQLRMTVNDSFFVKNILAQTNTNKCEFKSFCGPCVRRNSKDKWENCTCDTSTLQARGCQTQTVYRTPVEQDSLFSRVPAEDRQYVPNYYTTPVEVKTNLKCSGGYDHNQIAIGTTTKPCVKCDGTRGIWVSIEEKNCANLRPQTPPPVPTQPIVLRIQDTNLSCNYSAGCICEYSGGQRHEVPDGGTCFKQERIPEGGGGIPFQPIVEGTDLETGLAVEAVRIFDGQSCDYEQGCICKRDPIPQGSTCTITDIPEMVKGINFMKNIIAKIQIIVKSTFAQEQEVVSDFIIDQTTGLVAGLRAGVYVFDYDGKTYYFLVKEGDLENNPNGVLVYIDKNNNKKYDQGTDQKISDFGAQVKITALKEIYTYKLKEGFNFVTMPFITEKNEQRTAAGLLKSLNTQYGNSIFSIARYDGKWKVVGQNVVQYDTNDFQVVPGQGYIIKANKNIDISIIGYPIKYDSASDNAPITLYPGWNLIGTYGTNVKKYTAKSLIQGINSYEPIDFTADNVSRWESDVQRYDGFQLSNENGIDIEYGFDFPINTLQSYFVRILQGKGNWQPELK